MPRLIEYIRVGFCSGYGDGDYRVSCGVETMSRKEFDELRLALLNALHAAEEMWRRGNAIPEEAQPKEGRTMPAEQQP